MSHLTRYWRNANGISEMAGVIIKRKGARSVNPTCIRLAGGLFWADYLFFLFELCFLFLYFLVASGIIVLWPGTEFSPSVLEARSLKAWATRELPGWLRRMRFRISFFWPLPWPKEIKPVHPKGNQSQTSIGRTDADAEAPILWPPGYEEPTHWMLGKIDGRRRRGQQRTDSVINPVDMNLSKLWETVEDREA